MEDVPLPGKDLTKGVKGGGARASVGNGVKTVRSLLFDSVGDSPRRRPIKNDYFIP